LGGQLPEHGDLVAGETVEEQAPDSIDVTGRGGYDGASTCIGERDEGSAAVVGAPLTADEAALLHSPQLM
jgi:ABC-type enterochelin transport system substrate-binding protein